MARPKKEDPKTLKTRVVAFRVTDDEWERIAAVARASEFVSIAEMARLKTLGSRKPKRRREELVSRRSYDGEMYELVRKIGVNLNQIAHNFNADPFGGPPENLPQAIADVQQIMKLLSEQLEVTEEIAL